MEKKPRQRSAISSLISLAMIGLMIGLIWSALKVEPHKADDEYYQVVQYFDEGKVTEYELDFSSRELTYVLKGEKEKRNYEVPSTDLFIADVHETVRDYNKEHPDEPIKMNYEYGTSSYWLMQLLPMFGLTVALAVILYWAVKKMSNTMLDDTKRSMAFGKVRLKTGESAKKTTFEDVAGLDEEKEDLEEIVEFLKNPQKFSDLGARIPKGVILVGPPGTGKTLLARAVAGEADASFLSISGSDFVEMYVGVGASRVRDLFDNAKKNLPSIIFIDEIDAVGRHRGAGMGGGHDEREQTLNQLLVEMDGFGENAGVIVMAATNRPDILDPALLRPGRFDRQITVNYPDVIGREAILKVHARNKPIGPDVSLSEIARATSGFTGADLENLLNESALLAARRNKKAITKFEIEEATVKVIVGAEKKSKKITDEEKRLTAYHEAGHAITNYYLDSVDPVHQISIIPRGMAGGYTMSLPKEDKSSYMSKKQMLDQLVTLLGGRVAEALILGDISTGASNDIERATNIARSMITKYGMSDKLGPIAYGDDNDEVFLGKSYNHVRNYSEETASAIDKEVENIITEAYDRADDILRIHVKQLHIVARYLIEYEKIDGDEFVKLMSGDNEPEPPAEESPAEEPPAEEPSVKEPPVEESPVEESSVEDYEKDSTLGFNLLSGSEETDTEQATIPDEQIDPELPQQGEAVGFSSEIADDTDSSGELKFLFGTEEDFTSIGDDGLLFQESEEVIPSEIDEFPIEPKFSTEDVHVALSEAELQLKRELDRENGLISAEDEYAYAELGPDAIDEADISEYLESEPNKDEPQPELESLDIGGFISKSTDIYTKEELEAMEKVIGKRGFRATVKVEASDSDKNKESSSETEVDEDFAESDFSYAQARDDGEFTENDEIYALYELLKATRDFSEEEDDGDWKSKLKDD